MTKQIIWGNINTPYNKETWAPYQDDYNEYVAEQKENGLDESNICSIDDWYNDDNQLALDLTREDFENIKNENTIIAIADVGRWNGRSVGYKTYNNISEILHSECDYIEWYCDKYDVRFTGHHHDGTNYALYREIKDEDKLEKFCDLLYSGKITKQQISYYTRSIKPYITKLYK